MQKWSERVGCKVKLTELSTITLSLRAGKESEGRGNFDSELQFDHLGGW